MNAPLDRLRIVFAVFAAALVAYVLTPTADYFCDGITFALQIETVSETGRGWWRLVHPNHLVYNAVGYGLFRCVRLVFPTVSALSVLQVSNMAFGAAAVAVLFAWIDRLTANRVIALTCAAAFAFSGAWWKAATNSDAYVLSLLLILIAARNFSGTKPNAAASGLTFAGAMVIHQIASLCFPAFLAAVWLHPEIKNKTRFASGFSGFAWVTTVSAYAFCAVTFFDVSNAVGIVKWAVSNPSGISAEHNPIPGLKWLVRGNLDAVLGHNFAYFREHGGPLLWTVAGLSAVSFLIGAGLFTGRFGRRTVFGEGKRAISEVVAGDKPTLTVSLIWITTFSAFLIFWEPDQTYYRVFYLPALIVPLACILNRLSLADERKFGFVPWTVAGLALFNLAFYIVPFMDARSNPLYVEARRMNSRWNAETVVFFSDSNQADTAFQYFNRARWRKLTPATLDDPDAEIDAVLKRGGNVWLNESAARAVGSEWLKGRETGEEYAFDSSSGAVRYVRVGSSETKAGPQ